VAANLELGFVGLGRMGLPMTRNLLRAGYAVSVHNRSRAVVERLAAEGARPAENPAQVAAASDLALTCLPTPQAVEEVFFGLGGLLEGARASSILIDCSTVSPALSRRLYQAAAERGLSFLDAPVSGGPEGAEAATLTIMAGGDRDAFDRALPVLQTIGQNVHHIGPPGAGSAIKLTNQLLVGVHTAAAIEAAVLAAKAGVDPQMLLDVVSTSYGGSTMFRRVLSRCIERDFEPGSQMTLLIKDLELIHQVADELNTRTLLASVAHELFKEARALGHGDEDMAALVKPAERIAGVEVRRAGRS
jgi:3-hydroxyisobutyrate dehydrogenase/2-hydroxy-3-oxopropionate reductase